MVGRFAILCAIVGTPSVNAGGDPCVTAGVANVSCFGWSATDATDVVQAALDSTASTVYLDDPRGYVARPLTVTQSHKRVVLRPGVILAAKPGAFHGGSDTLLTVGFFKAGQHVSNVTVLGEGGGAGLRMRRADYDNVSAYTHAEHRHALAFLNVAGGACFDLAVNDTGGDGVYLRNVSDFALRRLVIRRAYRNGVSVIAARGGLLLEDLDIADINGTAPYSGIDLEPNAADEPLDNVTMRRCRVARTAGCGIEVKHAFALKAAPVPFTVTIDRCDISGIARSGIAVEPVRAGTRGAIRIVNSTVRDTACSGLLVGDKAADGAALVVDGLELRNVSAGCPDTLGSYGMYPITLNTSHLSGCGKKPWPAGQRFGGAAFRRTSIRGGGLSLPFFGVTALMPRGSSAANVTGAVDVYPPAGANATLECSPKLGQLGSSLSIRAVCHAAAQVPGPVDPQVARAQPAT